MKYGVRVWSQQMLDMDTEEEDPEQSITVIRFDTEAERAAFLLGMETPGSVRGYDDEDLQVETFEE